MAIFAHTKHRLYTLLRWSEKYTKNGYGVFRLRGSLVRTWYRRVSLIGLGTAVAFANLISKEGYGTYQYILSTVGLLGIFGLSGIKTAISHASAHGNDSSLFDAIKQRYAGLLFLPSCL